VLGRHSPRELATSRAHLALAASLGPSAALLAALPPTAPTGPRALSSGGAASSLHAAAPFGRRCSIQRLLAMGCAHLLPSAPASAAACCAATAMQLSCAGSLRRLPRASCRSLCELGRDGVGPHRQSAAPGQRRGGAARAHTQTHRREAHLGQARKLRCCCLAESERGPSGSAQAYSPLRSWPSLHHHHHSRASSTVAAMAAAR
jgi:hypothetical protein